METLHNLVFWSSLAMQAMVLAGAMYLMIWLFAALEAVL